MCTETTFVPIPAWATRSLSIFDANHPEFGIDNQGRKCFAIDSCIAPALQAVWDAGFKTLGCCCGHGQGYGVISLDLGLFDVDGSSRPDTLHHCSMCGQEHVPAGTGGREVER